jgi:hypothetical protein
MASLWSSSDAAQWQSALDGYWAALEGGGKPKLVELDRLVHVCDAAVSRSRVPGEPCVCTWTVPLSGGSSAWPSSPSFSLVPLQVVP